MRVFMYGVMVVVVVVVVALGVGLLLGVCLFVE